MPKFDPFKPPMSMAESERLLRSADDAKYSWASLQATFGVVLLLALFAGIGIALWLLSLVIGPTPAGIIGFVAVLIWLGKQE